MKESNELQERAPKLLSQIEPIENWRGTAIKKREQLKEFVEEPLLSACEELYDKNIQTLSSSANKKDIEIGDVGIVIDFETLSEENRKIGLFVGKLSEGDGRQQINISIPVDKNTTVKDVQTRAMEIVHQFQKQPMLWAEVYTLEDMQKAFPPDPENYNEKEYFDEIISYGYYYDPESKYFFLSKEHYDKTHE
ncbi:MAG: hypothetical protein ABR875_00085 [Minisyncoccia bacterium]|jgi:hypothetical protein